MSARDSSTFVVELTPAGRAAVAVVLVVGPRAQQATERWFMPNTPWTTNGPAISRILLGRWGGENGEELVVCRRGDVEFEIHCHGGAAAAPGIVSQLVDSGCESLSWKEWLMLARGEKSVLAQSETQFDGITAAAQIALADAPTARTAAVLLDQYYGALRKAIDDARASLDAGDLANASRIFEDVLKYQDVGRHLTSPWQVVIAGPPNVGKSSLINAIAGYQRAIVSPIPGTTRDVVTITTAIHGWPVVLADTAGLRTTSDELESAGVALAGAAIQQADLVLSVSDVTATASTTDAVESQLPPTARVLRVLNKIDLVDERDQAVVFADYLRVSALTGHGIAKLVDTIETALVPNAPQGSSAVAFSHTQIRALQAAREAISRADANGAKASLASMLATGADAARTS